MKFALVLCAIVAFAYAAPIDLDSQWTSFKSKYGKAYESETEEALRKKIFSENLQAIEEHNKQYEAGLTTFTMGVNEFTDLTPEEFAASHLGLVIPNKLDAEWASFKAKYGKTYETEEEETRRKEIFSQNFAKIQEHNKQYEAGLTTFTMAVNEFSDLTSEEFAASHLGLVIPNKMDAEWASFKAKYGKTYETEEEETRRKEIFSQNFEKIQEHNKQYEAGLTTFTMAVNEFSDLTSEEFAASHLGLVIPNKMDAEWASFKAKYGKTYETEEEEIRRKEIFSQNFEKIQEHNKQYEAGLTTFTMAVNEFSDLTAEEFAASHLGLVIPNKLDAEWASFKAKYGKTYETEEEETRRKEIFSQNFAKIQEHNKQYEAGLTTFTMTVNEFSDLTAEEFAASHLGLVIPNKLDAEWASFKAKYGKTYETEEEETRRKEIFSQNLQEIEDHNKKYLAGETTFTMGVNAFADLTEKEFADKYLMHNLIYSTPVDLDSQWASFKEKYGKSYESEEEETRRKEIFSQNLVKIEEHNKKYQAGESSYKMGVNAFTDLTYKEFADKYLMHNKQ